MRAITIPVIHKKKQNEKGQICSNNIASNEQPGNSFTSLPDSRTLHNDTP